GGGGALRAGRRGGAGFGWGRPPPVRGTRGRAHPGTVATHRKRTPSSSRSGHSAHSLPSTSGSAVATILTTSGAYYPFCALGSVPRRAAGNRVGCGTAPWPRLLDELGVHGQIV